MEEQFPLTAGNGEEVAEHLLTLTPARARSLGEAAYRRVLADHTYANRAVTVEAVLEGKAAQGVAS